MNILRAFGAVLQVYLTITITVIGWLLILLLPPLLIIEFVLPYVASWLS